MPIGTWKHPFPIRLGGNGHKLISDLHDAVVSNRPTVLRGAGGDVEIENQIVARAMATGIRAAQRRVLQNDPLKLSNDVRTYVDPETGEEVTRSPLERWERMLLISPVPGVSLRQRRADVSAKLVSFSNNTVETIRQLSSRILGALYYSVESNTIADVIAGNVQHRWPSGADTLAKPGTASASEWTSYLAHVLVVYDLPAGVSQDDADLLVQRLRRDLDDVVPAWCTFNVSRLDAGGVLGFFLDSSLLDLTALLWEILL